VPFQNSKFVNNLRAAGSGGPFVAAWQMVFYVELNASLNPRCFPYHNPAAHDLEGILRRPSLRIEVAANRGVRASAR